jgi:hypothetical protein
MQPDIQSLSPFARRAVDPGTPLQLRMMAAKGALPGVTPAEVILVLAVLSQSSDADLAGTARQTLSALPPSLLTGALASDLPAAAIDALVPYYGKAPQVVTQFLRMKTLSAETLISLAQQANEQVAEIIATNETLLLKHPEAIEKLYMNKATRMSTADRLIDLAVRNKIELNIPAFHLAAEALLGEVTAEPTLAKGYDELFAETERLAQEVEAKLGEDGDTHERNEEGEEKVKEVAVPLYARISQMSITQKIRRATLGTSAERLLLVRDSNRLVAVAAASSPMLNESDAARIASSRSVIEDVLRIICRNPEFTRSYQVKLNLVVNPRTPFTFSSRMLPLLRDNDLRLIGKSKQVPGAIGIAARNHMLRKQGK